MGLCFQEGASMSERIASSTWAMVPKKRKPADAFVCRIKTNGEKLTLQLDDGRLLGHLADVLPLQARTAHRGHGRFARLDGTDTPPLRTLHDEKYAYKKSQMAIATAAARHSQLAMIPNNTPMTKSHTAIHIMMLTIVRYSVLQRLLHFFQRRNAAGSLADTMSRIP